MLVSLWAKKASASEVPSNLSMAIRSSFDRCSMNVLISSTIPETKRLNVKKMKTRLMATSNRVGRLRFMGRTELVSAY